MNMIIYYVFAFMSMISAGAALSVGAFYWRHIQSALRVLVVLLFAGFLIDVYALYHIFIHANANRIWLNINHLLQFSLVIIALLRFGKDVLLTRLYWVLTFSLCGYCLAWFVMLLFVPQWLSSPYYTPLSYLLLLLLLAQTAEQFQRTSSLHALLPEFYVFFGFILYAFGTILLHCLKLFVVGTNPNTIYIIHGVLALAKNIFLIRAFTLDQWNNQRSTNTLLPFV